MWQFLLYSSDSAVHINISILFFQILLPYRQSQNAVQTSLCHTEDFILFPTSLSVMFPICAVSLFSIRSAVSWADAIPYLLGSVIGGLTAVFLRNKISVKWLHRILGLFILWGGIRFLWWSPFWSALFWVFYPASALAAVACWCCGWRWYAAWNSPPPSASISYFSSQPPLFPAFIWENSSCPTSDMSSLPPSPGVPPPFSFPISVGHGILHG